MPAYEKRLILFLDILGFREIVAQTATKPDALRSLLAAIDMILEFSKSSSAKSKRVSQFSDSFVVSYLYTEESAAFDLVNDVALLVIELAFLGFLVRGAITIGKLIHTKRYLVGPAMVKAYELESKQAKYPRVLIDPVVLKLARKYHASQNSPREEAGFVRDFMTKDPIDGRFYYDYVSWNSVVAHTGAEARYYGEYLVTLGSLIKRGLRHKKPDVQKKYLWLHQQYVAAIDLILAEPADTGFREENPGLCEDAADLPRFEALAQAARVAVDTELGGKSCCASTSSARAPRRAGRGK